MTQLSESNVTAVYLIILAYYLQREVGSYESRSDNSRGTLTIKLAFEIWNMIHRKTTYPLVKVLRTALSMGLE